MLPAALFSRCSSIGPGGFFLHNEPLNEFAGQGSMPQGATLQFPLFTNP